MQINQTQGIKPKMKEHKFRSGVNWHGVLKQKGIKQTGVKQGFDVLQHLHF